MDAFSFPVWPEAPRGPLGYFFPAAPEMPGGADIAAALDDLASAMADPLPAGPGEAGMPAIYACFARVIAADIAEAAGLAEAAAAPDIGRFAPLPRGRAAATLCNRHTGRLALDSLYGSVTPKAPGRIPAALVRLRTDADSPAPPGIAGSGGQDRNGRPTEASAQPAPDRTGASPFRIVRTKVGTEIGTEADIAQARPDGDRSVAWFHLALARFHQAVMAHAVGIGGPRPETGEPAFAFACGEVRKHFQWLVVNDYLRRICLPEVLEAVLTEEAPVYRDLLMRCPGLPEGRLPLPLEFQAAALGCAETMARPGDDWLARLGSGRPLPGGLAVFPRLRENVPVPNARKRRLAERRLHRGLRLNLPSGQGCVAGMARLGVRIAPLSPVELAEGPGGAVLARAGMIEATPLWYYLLREAEARSGGRRLGPLGSRILAETLVGLCVCDPDSYWHHLGSDHGRWHPRDGVRPAGESVTTVAALIRAAGMRA
ncbi:hypothetical protein JMK10_10120 [Rhodovulum sulfidophilum]|uniref:hypothetical protein n=1 Tax=Rhodovulum sulfidophilum TaxID=35806 RepID=UPI0019248B6B|nr:hypothetical protein [Rhodovulum sulfidophilum]MBL3572732.1 hypothetical protein [Rhodovulum sulfidophilum]MCE8433379.1 hypothetical protein [Rhodovulum sulfidophilum]MCF4117159.1 hypothetical protein [Rhodovulum sulfidophilum]